MVGFYKEKKLACLLKLDQQLLTVVIIISRSSSILNSYLKSSLKKYEYEFKPSRSDKNSAFIILFINAKNNLNNS